METSLTLSIPEIIFFLSGAIVLGITIRLFISTRREMRAKATAIEMNSPPDEKWKMKYLHDMNRRDGEISILREQIIKSNQNNEALSTELDDLRKQHNRFEVIREQLEKKIRDLDKKNRPPRIVLPEKTGMAARV